LWAPWRIDYLAGAAASESLPEPVRWQPGGDPNCFLCRAAGDFLDQDAADRLNFVVWRGNVSLAVLNRFPYANGHLLVSPLRHVAELADLQSVEQLEIMGILGRLTNVMRATIRAQGLTSASTWET
jgi:ATP adenylyltransferase